MKRIDRFGRDREMNENGLSKSENKEIFCLSYGLQAVSSTSLNHFFVF